MLLILGLKWFFSINFIIESSRHRFLILPKVKEADPTGMVPTSSTSITLLLGDCLAASGDTEGAKVAFEKALSLQPNNVESLRAYGKCMLKMRQVDQAIDTFTRAHAAEQETWRHSSR